MKAMILAAGLGERMRPLTDARAKPSLPLLNRPIIAHTIDLLKRHGVDEVVINLHYQPESIRGLVGDGSRHGVRVHYSEEPIILGTAGGLKKAEPFLAGAGTFIMINSDCISDCDLTAAVARHTDAGALATMILVAPRPGADYGVVEVGDKGQVLRISGVPAGEPDPRAGRYHFTGVHILEPAIFDAIPAQGRSEINSEVYPRLIKAGKRIIGSVHAGFWRELGTPRLYLDGSIAWLREGKDPALQSLRASDGVYLERLTLGKTVTVDPPVLVGRGASIGEGTGLHGGSIIGRQAVIGKGCSLRSTVVWEGARIGDGTSLSDCIVTSGVYVAPGVSLSSKIFVRAEGYHGRKDRIERLGGCWMIGL